jgi:hypothetical protein
MWLVIQRQPRPDARVWTGRRALAALDAVAFPTMWLLVIVNSPYATGLVGLVVSVASVLFATSRLTRAIWQNERYRFTTWRWAQLMAPLLLIAVMLKLAIQLGVAS